MKIFSNGWKQGKKGKQGKMKGKGAEIDGLHIRNGFRRQQLKPLRKLSHAFIIHLT
jgi:hypothetical protein